MQLQDAQVITSSFPAAIPDEQRLVGAAKAGCREAFTELVENYHPRVLRYLTRQTGDREMAADLTQETFLDAYRRLERLKDDRPFLAWLYRIAHYNLLQEWRRQRRRSAVSLDKILADLGRAPRALHQVDKTAGVHEQELIQQTLDTLSPTLRAPIVLQDLYGFSSQEVAAMLDISWAAARQRIARGRAEFRQHYQRSNGSKHISPLAHMEA